MGKSLNYVSDFMCKENFIVVSCPERNVLNGEVRYHRNYGLEYKQIFYSREKDIRPHSCP